MTRTTDVDGIAIIGIALRLPGAPSSPSEFWNNLRNGVESITFFSEAELAAAGVDCDLLNHAHYVRASPVVKHHD